MAFRDQSAAQGRIRPGKIPATAADRNIDNANESDRGHAKAGFALLVAFRPKAGKLDLLARLLLEASRTMSRCPGCLVHVIASDRDVPDILWVTELWTSKLAHDDAVQSPEASRMTVAILEISEREGRAVTMDVIRDFEASGSGRNL
jgi:quinol monooxygenase YgiN